jgi:hypothetical protein
MSLNRQKESTSLKISVRCLFDSNDDTLYFLSVSLNVFLCLCFLVCVCKVRLVNPLVFSD